MTAKDMNMMKRCKTCNRIYTDEAQLYCLDDGTALVTELPPSDLPPTEVLPNRAQGVRAATTAVLPPAAATTSERKRLFPLWILGVALLLLMGAGIALVLGIQRFSLLSSSNSNKPAANTNTSNANSGSPNLNSADEANKLVDSAKADLEEVDLISTAADEKQKQLNRATAAKDVDKVKKILGELINDIDNGTNSGTSAAEKIERATKYNINATYKRYLTLKAQAFRKELAAYAALREAAVIARDNYTEDGLESEQQQEYDRKVALYKKLKAEAKALHKRAADLQRANPDKIK